ncbi:hypothetical protein M422DRAFT_254919 [Sphaerobolus stellatus SS14]|uniref:Uncharacterized protein n=1 Tax=Sphaerobolus stellatus (strain SS14) TaxID=990650 RepID=A0A0C9VUI9_SPHS4|nr:hypothetical protein M422DRAFT_254919 [Sphaerobolus stellatus SS14]
MNHWNGTRNTFKLCYTSAYLGSAIVLDGYGVSISLTGPISTINLGVRGVSSLTLDVKASRARGQ